MDVGTALALGADGLTAAAAAFNAAWLAAGPARNQRTAGRRFGALTLAAISAGAAVQAAFSLALFASHTYGFDSGDLYAPGPWVASRVVLLAGTVLLSMLILRRNAR
jgi:hypothetical protein